MATNNAHATTGNNDELYTLYDDVKQSVVSDVLYNPDLFTDKTVLCPFNDAPYSAFARYFSDNFNALKLKKLICISYAGSPRNSEQKHGQLFIQSRGDDKLKFIRNLKTDGDFRFAEVSRIADKSDIVYSYPPGTKFEQALEWCLSRPHLKFSLLGNLINAATLVTFPYMANFDIWWSSVVLNPGKFETFDPSALNCTAVETARNGANYLSLPMRWYTNIPSRNHSEFLELHSKSENLAYNSQLRRYLEKHNYDDYPMYTDYPAMECPYVEAIPSDYPDVMGVPLTFFDVYNPNQFAIAPYVYRRKHSRDMPRYHILRTKLDQRSAFSRVPIRVL